MRASSPPLKRRRLNVRVQALGDHSRRQTIPSKRRPLVCGGCSSFINPCACYVRCVDCSAACTNLDVLICSECFKKGQEFKTHKLFHRYSLLREVSGSFPSRDDAKDNQSEWEMKDIWSLQGGIRKFGIGSATWSQIAKYIDDPTFDSTKCQQFVFKNYGKPSSARDPDDPQSVSPSETTSNSIGETVTLGGHKSKGNGSGITKKEREHTRWLTKCGYNLFRDEFEAEWNAEAEDIISGMFLSAHDTMLNYALYNTA